MSREYREQMRAHQEWIHNSDLWTSFEYEDNFNLHDAAAWVDMHEDDIVGKYLIQVNQLVFSDAQDATLFALTR